MLYMFHKTEKMILIADYLVLTTPFPEFTRYIHVCILTTRSFCSPNKLLEREASFFQNKKLGIHAHLRLPISRTEATGSRIVINPSFLPRPERRHAGLTLPLVEFGDQSRCHLIRLDSSNQLDQQISVVDE